MGRRPTIGRRPKTVHFHYRYRQLLLTHTKKRLSVVQIGGAFARCAQKGAPMEHADVILVVDPESSIVNILVELLTEEGYVVLSASDGRSALRLCKSHAPALLLVEEQLSDMSPDEFMIELRDAGVTSTPIVLMTTAMPELAPALTLSMREYLWKPFDIADVLACVERYARPAVELAVDVM